MTRQTEAYRFMVRRIAERRRALVKTATGRLIYPPAGTPWTPNKQEQAVCESYIVLFVAELETYIEEILSEALTLYMSGLRASLFSELKTAKEFYSSIKDKHEKWKKNNNTNWSRISDFFEFTGLNKDKFPSGLWDDIERIAKERGGIVHKSAGARTLNDPRIAFGHMDALLRSLLIFDRDAAAWLSEMQVEVARLASNPVRFTPGIGSIGAAIVV